ncbi:MAG: DNA mismatch repair protein MutS [Planctomycetota bacterium]|nr:DNA mismatch repair protein MutS [Planctomycetota bacterium]
MADPRSTPAMQQYARFKAKHPDCVLLFRMGDFYEMFDEDAVRVSKAIGLTLTQRSAGVPMAGMPFHQLDTYLRKLIAAGFRVAVCDQIEDASQAKGLVARAVTRVITPGTIVDEQLLESGQSGAGAARIGAVAFLGTGEDAPAALAVADASTGEMVLVDVAPGALMDELARRSVTELLYAHTDGPAVPPRIARAIEGLRIAGTSRPQWHFRPQEAPETLRKHYGVATLAGFGLRDDDAALIAAAVLVRYLADTQTALDDPDNVSGKADHTLTRPTLRHLAPPRRETRGTRCEIDAVSLRALEIERTVRAALGSSGSVGGADGSLLGVFLSAGPGKGTPRTAMGRRLLRDWLCQPSADLAEIRTRHDGVATLVSDRRVAREIGEALDLVQDVARLSARVALARATPRDIVALGVSIGRLPALIDSLANAPGLSGVRMGLESCRAELEPLGEIVRRTCVEHPPAHLREGGLFREGVDAELDEARLLQRDAGAWLSDYQTKLIAEHNLPHLKVGFNKVFGYYIELPAAQARSAPATLIRKQTLRNAERFTTPELREFEGKVMTAEARALERERVLFQAMCDRLSRACPAMNRFAESVARLDTLLALADRASAKGWNRPELTQDGTLRIVQGRHPVLEELRGSDFVPNDLDLGREASDNPADRARLALITGPNMAGKSTFIRQVALITVLAHVGSFVPAESATVGLTDRIFTRIGADDALHAGQSTFMVEMTETANILHHATPRSLVILDEIGRGTSTLDGLSLAWSIAEFLAGQGEHAGPRTLFATHYHELTELEDMLPGRVRNLHVAVREWSRADAAHPEIIFLHRILPGRTDQSYGVHVARLAGIPPRVVERAREVLASLSVSHGLGGSSGASDGASSAGNQTPASDASSPSGKRGKKVQVPPRGSDASQIPLFTEFVPHPAMNLLREVKLETLSPMQAFDMLRKLKDEAERA